MTSPAMTEAGIILGTAAHMSPEQAKGRSVDHRADIWAFGVVFFEMLAGRPPSEGESISDGVGDLGPAGPFIVAEYSRSDTDSDGGDRVQVSAAGGRQPRWNPNGRELFYVGPGRTLMAVPVTSGATFAAGTPVGLFRAAFPTTGVFYYGGMAGYDVGINGDSFVINSVIRAPDSGPLMVALNWLRPGER